MVLGFIFASNFGMLAPQNNTNDITDALSGSLTTWYQNVDSALKASECVPGYYEYAQAPSYGTQCPIQEGGSTKIDIQTARFNVIDIDNSYIDVDFTVPITLSNLKLTNDYSNTDGNDTDRYCYYVGFKSAFDVIDQYRIYSNGDLVYTQNHANFESFLNYIALTDTAKNNNECFATWDKIQAMDPGVPGTYIVFEDNGPGVNEDNQSKLFTPNFTTKSGGTGLGLAICRNIVEKCGGEIFYQKSFSLGGACFTVSLPKIPSRPAAITGQK